MKRRALRILGLEQFTPAVGYDRTLDNLARRRRKKVRAKSATLISVRLGLVPRRLLRDLGRGSCDALVSRQSESRRTDCCACTKANGVTTGDEHWHLRGKIVCLTNGKQKLFRMTPGVKAAVRQNRTGSVCHGFVRANRQPEVAAVGRRDQGLE
jgi:hypothetical protein